MCTNYEVYITEQDNKGRRDVDFPLDDYFMSLAVLATCRSVVPENKVRVLTSLAFLIVTHSIYLYTRELVLVLSIKSHVVP